jgi:predicted  nucleic acid-binding Zn-ribbon protein
MTDYAEPEDAARQVRREYDQLAGEMEAAIEHLQNTNEDLERMLTEMDARNDHLRAENEELREEIRSLRARLLECESEIDGPRLAT